MTSDLQQARYDKLVRRVGAIVGPGSKVTEALPELFPTLDVENVPGELLILMGTNLSVGGGAITSAGSDKPKAQVFNPAGSGVIATVTRVDFSSDGNTTVRAGFSFSTFGAAITTQLFTDRRQGGATQRPTCAIRTGVSTVLAAGTIQTRVQADVGGWFENENGLCILAPNSGFEIGLAAAAADLTFTFWWRERRFEQSEINF